MLRSSLQQLTGELKVRGCKLGSKICGGPQPPKLESPKPDPLPGAPTPADPTPAPAPAPKREPEGRVTRKRMTPLRKRIGDITDALAREDVDTRQLLEGGYRQPGRRRDASPRVRAEGDLADLIAQLSEQMHAAAAELQFELAARLRDEIADLKKELRQMRGA